MSKSELTVVERGDKTTEVYAKSWNFTEALVAGEGPGLSRECELTLPDPSASNRVQPKLERRSFSLVFLRIESR